MEKVKENAIMDFVHMISNSWTWGRMTDEERQRFTRCIDDLPKGSVTGTYDSRWQTLHAIYSAFLAGLGYDGANWREPPKQEEETDIHAIRREYLRNITNPHPVIGHPHY